MFLVCHYCSTGVPNCLEKNQNTLWSIKVCVEKQIQQYNSFKVRKNCLYTLNFTQLTKRGRWRSALGDWLYTR